MYGELVVGISGDPARLDAILNRLESRLQGMARRNWQVPVSLDTKMLGDQIGRLKRLPSKIGKLVFEAEVKLKTDGSLILQTKNNLQGIENQAKKADSSIRVLHKNLQELGSGSTNVKLNTKDLAQGLSRTRSNQLRYSREFDSSTSTSGILGEINKLEGFFRGQGIKADAFNKIIPELQRVLKLQEQIKANRKIDFTVNVTGNNKAKIQDLTVTLDGADKRMAVLSRMLTELEAKGGKAMVPLINGLSNTEDKIRRAGLELNNLKNASGTGKVDNGYNAAKYNTRQIEVLNKLLVDVERRGGGAMLPLIRGLATTEEQIRRAGMELNRLKTSTGGMKINNGLAAAKAEQAELNAQLKQFQALLRGAERTGGLFLRPFIKNAQLLERQLLAVKDSGRVLDRGEFGTKMTAAIQRLNSEKVKADGLAGRLEKRYQGLAQIAGHVGNTIARWAFGYVVVSQLIRAMRELSEATIGYNDVLDKGRLTFTAGFLGNRDLADDLIKRMQKLAAYTNFSFKDLLPYTQKLMVAGRNAKTVIADISGIGDFVALKGQDKEMIGRITYALNQIKTAGKVMGTEVRQLTEALVPASQILADAWGVSTSKMQEWIKQGIVPADKAVKALIQGMSKMGDGFMEKQARTLMGAVTNIQDAIQRLIGGAFRPLYDELTRNALILNDFLNSPEAEKRAEKWAGVVTELINKTKAAFTVLNDMKGVILGVGAAMIGVKIGAGLVGLFTMIKDLQALSAAGGILSAGGSMANLGPILTPIIAFATNPAVLAVLAGTVLIGGIALWANYNRELEKTRAITSLIQKSTKAMSQSFSDMDKVVGGNRAAKHMLFALQKDIETAHGNTDKLKRALERLNEADIKIKNLKLDTGSENVFKESIRELRAWTQKELSGIQVTLNPQSVTNVEGMVGKPGKRDYAAQYAAIAKEAKKYKIAMPAQAVLNKGETLAEFTSELATLQTKLANVVAQIQKARTSFMKIPDDAESKFSDAPRFKVPRLLEGKGASNLEYLKKEYAKYEALIKKQGNFTGADKTALANLKNAINRLNAVNDKLVDTMYSEDDLMRNNAKNQAKELNKQAALYDRLAAAAEASAKRQIAALQNVAGQIREMFGSSQSELLKYGVVKSPSNTYIQQLEKLLNLKGKANVALGEWNDATALRDQAQNAREAAGNLSGTTPEPSSLGMKIANAAVRMQAQARKFEDQCDKLADTTVRGVTKVYDAFMGPGKGRGSAAETMEGFQKAGKGFAANGSYAPGDIVYSGRKFGKGSGHVMIVGPDGKFYDQYGANVKPKTTPEWVVRPGGNSNVGKFRRGPLGGKNQTAAQLMGDESPLAGVNLSLSQYANLPKEFGKPIPELANNTARFALQVKLLDENFQNWLRSSGKFKQAIDLLKKGANADDLKLNFERLQKAAHTVFKGRAEELSKRMRGRGKENDPFAAIEEARRKGGDLHGLSELDAQILKNKTLRDTLDGLTFSIRQGNQALELKNKALEAGRKFITQSGVDEYAYAKAIEKRGREIAYWNREDVKSLYGQGKALQDYAKKLKQEIADLQVKAKKVAAQMTNPAAAEKLAASLLGKNSKLKKAQQEAKTIATDLNRNAQTDVAGWETDYDGNKANDRSLLISRARGELDLQNRVLAETIKLTQNWKGSELALSDAIAKKEAVIRKIKEFQDAGFGAQSKSLANEMAHRESVNRALERTKSLMDEIRESGKELALTMKNSLDARGLMSQFQGNDGVRDYMTRLSEMVNEKNKKILELPSPGLMKLKGLNRRSIIDGIKGNYDKQAESLKLSFENSRIQSALSSAFQMELDLKTRILGLERGVTEEKKLQMQFDLEDAALKKANLTPTPEEIDGRKRQLAAARSGVGVDIEEWKKSLFDESALSRLFGKARLDEQFRQMGRGKGWTDQVINELLPVDQMYRRMKQLFDGMDGLMSDWQGSWSEMWQGIGKTGTFSLDTLLNNLTDRLVSWGAQVLADQTWNQLIGILGSILPVGKIGGGSSGGTTSNPFAAFNPPSAGTKNPFGAFNPASASLPTKNAVAMELTRGAAMSNASVSAARSGAGSGGDVYFTGPVSFPGVRDMANAKSAIDQKVNSVPQSRRSNSKMIQSAASGGI